MVSMCSSSHMLAVVWAQIACGCPRPSRHTPMSLASPTRRMGTVRKRVRCTSCSLLWDLSDLASSDPAICNDCLGVDGFQDVAEELPDTHSGRAARKLASSPAGLKKSSAAGIGSLGVAMADLPSASPGAGGSACSGGSHGRRQRGSADGVVASGPAVDERHGQKRARSTMKRPAAA